MAMNIENAIPTEQQTSGEQEKTSLLLEQLETRRAEIIERHPELATKKSIFNDKEIESMKAEILDSVRKMQKKAKDFGYSLSELAEFERSGDEEKRALFEEVMSMNNIDDQYWALSKEAPDDYLDLCDEVNEPIIISDAFRSVVENSKSSAERLTHFVDKHAIEIANDYPDFRDKINDKIIKDKSGLLSELPADEVVEYFKNDPGRIICWKQDACILEDKLAWYLDGLIETGELNKAKEFYELISGIEKRHGDESDSGNFVPRLEGMKPAWFRRLHEEDLVKVLDKTISVDRFRDIFDYGSNYIPLSIIPDELPEETKREIYYPKILNKINLTIEDIDYYMEISSSSLEEVIKKSPRALSIVVSHEGKRKTIFDYLKNRANPEDPETQTKVTKYQNFQDAFIAKQSPEKLPPEVEEIRERFNNQFGIKGKNLISLAIVAYGIENLEQFSEKTDHLQGILEKYQPENVPEGAHTSMGIEYEVTDSLAEDYEPSTFLNYKKDIEMATIVGDLGVGRDGVHEIFTKPTYNPYMLLAEVKLLQDAGFIDFNFIKYPKAARGYHLSLVGDSGLKVNHDMYFLNNLMAMTQLSGVLGGKEIDKSKGIHSKEFADFSEQHKQKGHRIEFKDMSCDTVEQFEKAIITAHHAGIAVQVANKHIPGVVNFATIPDDPEVFERMIMNSDSLVAPFESDNERDIAYHWAKLKRGIVDAAIEHNASFVNSEFQGFVVDEKGNVIDTSEHIDIKRNQKLVPQEAIEHDALLNDLQIPVQNIFEKQDNPVISNILTKLSNIFLKDPVQGDLSSINLQALLSTVRKEGYGDLVDGKPRDSIFDKKDGELRDGYYVFQGASEEMILHKAQILLSQFNKAMEELLHKPIVKRHVEQKQYEYAS